MNNKLKDNKITLLNSGVPLIKKKKKSLHKKTPLSKEYKVFLKNSRKHKASDTTDKNAKVKNTSVKNTSVKNTHVKNTHVKNMPVKNTPVKDTKYVKIVKVNKNNYQENNFVKVIENKDIHKSKNKFTKKSQEKKNKRNSKRKKIHRKITKVKRLSFRCNDNKLDVKKLIKETHKKSNQEIKEALKKKGIDIKSNKNKLLKDLYLFTSCNNINVVRE